MVKTLTLMLGSGLPAWAAWSYGLAHGIMAAWWMAVVAFSLGWYVSRRFVRDYLD